MPDWINQAFSEYTKRLSGEIRISLIEVTAERRSKTTDKETSLLREAERIKSVLPKTDRYIALDERGKQFDTEDLSEKLNTWIYEGISPGIVIGGADGLHASIKTGAAEIWSLSKLTLPHALVRILLVEQLYRAWTILKGHPYHRK